MGLVKALVPALALLAGCSLYYEDDPPPAPDDGWIDDGDTTSDDGPGDGDGDGMGMGDDDAQPAGNEMIVCEDGVVRLTSWNYQESLPHGVATEVATCGTGECQAASALCDGDCNAAVIAVCNAAPAGVPTSELQGASCTADAQSPLVTGCGMSVPGSNCDCVDGVFACTEATPVAATQAALVGKWRGLVTTPWGDPYEGSLWIYPDGSYWAETEGAVYPPIFYYGYNGPHPDLRIQLLSVDAATGSYGHVAQWPDHAGGQISGLVVTASTLAFTFNASWHNCAQPITFDLTRED
jgi:hypothetical protein